MKNKNQNLSISNIVEQILEVENKYDLFNLSIDGIKIYQHLRMILYYEVTRQLNIFSTQTQSPRNIDRLSNFVSYLTTIFCPNIY